MQSAHKGLWLILLTALSSGIAIFVNKYSLASFESPFVFTFLKNALVVVVLAALVFGIGNRKVFSGLPARAWAYLIVIGAVGGGIAFLLYFFALQSAQALTAGFLHKTLFVWAGLLGAFWLREKIDKTFMVAAALLLAGNVLLFWGVFSFGLFETLILAAVILWAIENALARRVFEIAPQLNGLSVAFARLFFGALLILGFLAFAGELSGIGELTVVHWQWVLLTGAFLLVYVASFYAGLRLLPLHQATALLSAGQVVTATLVLFFGGHAPTLIESAGLLLLLAGVVLVGLAVHFNTTTRTLRTVSKSSLLR